VPERSTTRFFPKREAYGQYLSNKCIDVSISNPPSNQVITTSNHNYSQHLHEMKSRIDSNNEELRDKKIIDSTIISGIANNEGDAMLLDGDFDERMTTM
jgi:hypothetical protein